MAEYAYTTLSHADLLMQAKDTLRSIETDHYRISLREQTQADTYRLADLEEQAEVVRAEIARLEKPADTATTGASS